MLDNDLNSGFILYFTRLLKGERNEAQHQEKATYYVFFSTLYYNNIAIS